MLFYSNRSIGSKDHANNKTEPFHKALRMKDCPASRRLAGYMHKKSKSRLSQLIVLELPQYAGGF
ncbi:MAG: hypothetical protein DKT66_12620 [Candidatus Melainabacteria bacterium]|nr:MAG: hypothetical protein DKT66_12620 [Candidatus Melainabacteria bacterium]